MFKPFHATNKPSTCLWCGHKLRPEYLGSGLGVRGEGLFCSLKCGYRFAASAANTGFRFEPADSPPKKPKRKPADKTSKCEECGAKLKLHFGIQDDIYLYCDNLQCELKHQWLLAGKIGNKWFVKEK